MTIEDIISTSENSVLFNVFQMPYLTGEECDSLAKKVLENRYSHPHEGSMQKYTVDVTPFLGEFLTNIMEKLTPIINELYYFGKGNTYSLFTAHAILYSADGQGERSLGLHVDDADVTVNLTLQTENLKGCEIGFMDSTEYGNDYCITNFGRAKAKLDGGCHVHTVVPEVGTLLFHRGNHPHRTFYIQQGSRIALILWLKKRIIE